MVRTSKSRNIHLPKTLNHSTGKVSNRQTRFNDITWGDSTRSYAKSITKNLRNNRLDNIITQALEFSKKSQRSKDGTDGALDGGDVEEEEDDERAQLMDISSSESDEDTSKCKFIHLSKSSCLLLIAF
jgi:hypothetical protein